MGAFINLHHAACAASFLHQDLQNTANEEKKSNLWKFTPHTTRVADNYDLKYHRCIWNIDPAVYYISGSVTSFFEPKDEGFAEIDFDFDVNMSVDSVKYHGSSITFSQQSDDVLEISLPAVIPVGQLDSVTVYYQGEPIGSGFGSFVQSTHANKHIIWDIE
jgi:hypothetical protein